ncbi:hypothetical protein [Asaia prunellae]|uniref:hypothetical protein n=1 Tax=Asaia prunellae TaxID=610245 RepID=UPI0011DD53A2|nr:hypothetical protein [Asaia prunellae]
MHSNHNVPDKTEIATKTPETDASRRENARIPLTYGIRRMNTDRLANSMTFISMITRQGESDIESRLIAMLRDRRDPSTRFFSRCTTTAWHR